ncbi:SCO family protein [Alkalihalobacillus sp. LMS39]|uniref:SCO family protein n=1 Tax=Alkalihalobacillus sp. LMS39 TaxID=2924032 RepID=UPI001FB2DF76|nr:SCO family protein [Alkalihalobacillus sp. LMS39]UOE95858.1 SCO family protein [Alkalihalobacillus sp. LMS39]
MNNSRRHIISVLIVCFFGSLLFYVGTDGFTAFTAETARVNQLMKQQPQFPEVTFEDNSGRMYPFSEFETKYVFITFMYTTCTSVCWQLEMNMAEVYARIPKQFIGNDIVFLSISFDPETDDPATLNQYKNYFKSDGETWRMARIPNQEELDRLLQAFGVIVIPDEYGNFAHNSAFYFVDRKGTLQHVMDFTKPKEAAATVRTILENEKGG